MESNLNFRNFKQIWARRRRLVCKFKFSQAIGKIKSGAKMKRRDFIKGAATCAAGFAAGVNLFAQQTGETSAANLTDGVDLSGTKNLGERLAAMTPYLTLNNRILMPIVGLSASKFDDLKDKNALGAALGLGYRLIDTDGRRGESGCCICG